MVPYAPGSVAASGVMASLRYPPRFGSDRDTGSTSTAPVVESLVVGSKGQVAREPTNSNDWTA